MARYKFLYSAKTGHFIPLLAGYNDRITGQNYVPSQRTDRRPPGSEPGVPPLYEKGIFTCSEKFTIRKLRTAIKTEQDRMEPRTRT